jgi:beta-1,4-mannosyltransferase
MFNLLGILLRLPNYDSIVIQNPPCLPALIVALFMGVTGGSKVIVDWHNLGFKMFENDLGPQHPLVRLSKGFEFLISHYVHGHVCVSKAMKDWLQDHFFLHPVVVYDRPSSVFSASGTDLLTEHNLFRKYKFTDREFFPQIADTGDFHSTSLIIIRS